MDLVYMMGWFAGSSPWQSIPSTGAKAMDTRPPQRLFDCSCFGGYLVSMRVSVDPPKEDLNGR